ncbi:hypothetical protein ACLI4R_17530 [Natrialbaceae archaeon A-chndr2]
MIDAARHARDRSSEDDERVVTRWRDGRGSVLVRDEPGARVSVVVQSRRRDVWIDEARWSVSSGGIDYVSGDVDYMDGWFAERKMQERRVRVYADDSTRELVVVREWRGPPGREFERLADLEWRSSWRWRIDEFGARRE